MANTLTVVTTSAGNPGMVSQGVYAGSASLLPTSGAQYPIYGTDGSLTIQGKLNQYGTNPGGSSGLGGSTQFLNPVNASTTLGGVLATTTTTNQWTHTNTSGTSAFISSMTANASTGTGSMLITESIPQTLVPGSTAATLTINCRTTLTAGGTLATAQILVAAYPVLSTGLLGANVSSNTTFTAVPSSQGTIVVPLTNAGGTSFAAGQLMQYQFTYNIQETGTQAGAIVLTSEILT